ncbi:MAG: hypothetical protein AB8C13_02505 [Phycisphaerales bacterium]
MRTTLGMLVSILMTLSVCAASVSAQIGPRYDQIADPAVNQSQDPLAAPASTARNTIEPAPVVNAQEQSVERSPTQSTELQPLGLPRASRASQSSEPLGENQPATPLKLGKEFVRTVATLGGVLLLIFALAHIYKRIARTQGGLSGQIGAGGKAPAGLVEVLGRYPISSGMTLVVLRFDRKVLLLSHAGGRRGKRGSASLGSMQTLCEVSSPEEVASILGKVRDEAGDSIAATFERTLEQAGNATDAEISQAMYEPTPGMTVQRPRRVAPGFVSNDEGDRLELTSTAQQNAASQVLRRRLGSMRRDR